MTSLKPIPTNHLPTTETAFCAWLGQASAGDAFEYHRGSLAMDVGSDGSKLGSQERRELCCIARRARWAAERGLVHLLQRRNGPDDFTYLVVARSRSTSMPAGLSSSLVVDEARD